jgi:hypothetical protein
MTTRPRARFNRPSIRSRPYRGGLTQCRRSLHATGARRQGCGYPAAVVSIGRWESRLGASLLGGCVALVALAFGVGETARSAGGDSPPKVPPRFFGVVSQVVPTTAEFDRMKAGKVGRARFRIYWPSIQTSENAAPSHWGRTDDMMVKMATAGVRPVPFIMGSPQWVSDDPFTPPLNSPEAKEGWKNLLRVAAIKYGPDGTFWQNHPELPPNPIRDYQIWNEQNGERAFKPKPSPRRYAKLLKISHKAVTSVDPGANIILGGMVGKPQGERSMDDRKYLDRLYELKGVKRRFEGVALHPYSRRLNGSKIQIRQAREVMKEHHDARTGVWITEIGWGSGDSGSRLDLGPRGQKRSLKAAFSLFREERKTWNLKTVLWFSWRDHAVGCAWCRRAGLLEYDLTPKPSWRAFTRFTGGVPEPPPPTP